MPAAAPLDILLAGCGKMGGALLHGWLVAGIAKNILVLDPAPLPAALAETAPAFLSFFDGPESLAAHDVQADLCVIAVKPQILETACTPLAPLLPPGVPVLSIAAGQTLDTLARLFGTDRPLIRAMPNTPASIGKGISVAVANAAAEPAHQTRAETALKAVGAVEWVTNEALLDPVTAVSGSGPAYVFLLIEALAAAGEKAGLAPDFAMRLARATVTGSAALAESAPDTSAAALRKAVTSPGGTTAAALDILMKDGALETLMTRAVAAATARSAELGR